MLRSSLTILTTLGLGFGGGFLFLLGGLPAAWLSGSMAAVAAGAIAGLPVHLPRIARDFAFILVGTSMGSTVTPETLSAAATWPLSLVGLAVSVSLTIGLVSLYLERVRGWDAATARYTSVPGALSFVLLLAASSDADVPRVAFAQCLRLVILVMLAPPLIGQLGHGAATIAPALAAEPAGLIEIVALIAISAATGWLLVWIRVPAGTLLGGMLASAVLHGSGILVAALPQPVLITAFVASGVVIGERFRGTRLAVVIGSLRGAVEGIAVAVTVSAACAWLVAETLGLPFGQVWLAYAPGGTEAMAILALMLDLNPAYVGAHHVLRYIGLSFLGRLWEPRRAPRTGPAE